MKKELQDARREYQQRRLVESEVHEDAIEQFQQWLREYREVTDNDFNAMTLCTVDDHGKPSARVVLLKGIDADQFEFFTNYSSRKGLDIKSNPYVSLSFFWPELERQVIIEGKALRMSEDESSDYFNSRPYGSRIGALASPQSQPISLEQLEKNVQNLKEQYPEFVPKPRHWGGYQVKPVRIEFWQGRENRLHDRIEYNRTVDDGWTFQRLAP